MFVFPIVCALENKRKIVKIETEEK